MWPRTAKVYCHPVEEWPADADLIERVPTRSCVRRGAAIDLVLDRGRENRSQLVMTRVRGRQVIFWQSSRTAKQARPGVRTPTARASGVADLEVVVDSRERYGYTFADRQVTTVGARLEAGDYGLFRHGTLLATVERKSLSDLVSPLTTGRLKYQLADLVAVPRAALVVEDRYSAVSRKLAQEWTYRFLAAASVAVDDEYGGEQVVTHLSAAKPLLPAPPTPAEVRAWAMERGYEVSGRGRVPARLVDAFRAARGG